MRVQIQPFFSMSIYYILAIAVMLLSLFLNFPVLQNIVFVILIMMLVVESCQLYEYLSSILINDSAIILELRTFLKTRHIVIPADDIKNFNVDVKVYSFGIRGNKTNYKSQIANILFATINYKTVIKISTPTGDYIYNVKNVMNCRLCPYETFLRLLDVANFIPNFSKTFDTNDAFTYKNINYYLKHHKQLPFIERFRRS